jgi:hypothetical protein
MRSLTVVLHLIQPAARLAGRLSLGLAPWRQSPTRDLAVPRPLVCTAWFERWLGGGERVARLEVAARLDGARVVRGGPYDRWDLEVSGGSFGAVRLLVAVEEHGRGRQLLRCRLWPVVPSPLLCAGAVLAVLAGSAMRVHQWPAAFVCTWLLVGLVTFAAWECALATAAALAAFRTSVAAPETGEPRSGLPDLGLLALEET